MNHEHDIARKSTELASETPERDAAATRDRGSYTISRFEHLDPYVRVWVDVPDSWRRRHIAPGQYLTARFGDTRHRFLVIANSPHDAAEVGFELLIEPNTDLAPLLDALEIDSSVMVSAPEGPGFPTHVPGTALLFATGSGIAGLRPVLQHWSAHPESRPASVVVFYEESLGTGHAYQHELSRWSEQGWIDLRLSTVAIERGGRLEEVFEEAFEEEGLELEAAEALLCGSPAMIAAVTAELLRRGLPSESVHTNI